MKKDNLYFNLHNYQIKLSMIKLCINSSSSISLPNVKRNQLNNSTKAPETALLTNTKIETVIHKSFAQQPFTLSLSWT